MIQRIILTVRIVIGTSIRRVPGDKPPDTRIVVAMPEQHQATVGIGLVLRSAHKPEGCGVAAGRCNQHPEGIIAFGVRNRLAGVGLAAGAAEGISMIEAAC